MDYEQSLAKAKYESLIKKYSGLGFDERQMKRIYNNICNGSIKPGNPEMKRYLDAIAKKKMLLDFIDFLKDASEYSYYTRVGTDSFDPVLDKGTYSKMVRFGFGGVPKREDSPYLSPFIAYIEREYYYQIQLEESDREDAKKAANQRTLEVYERYEAEFKPVRERYEKYLADYKLWCSKDAYWHSSHLDKLPSPEKYGLTDDDLEKLGYYSAEAKNERLSDYRNACIHYESTNSFLKKIVNGGKVMPTPSNYGLSNDEVWSLYEGELLTEGRPRR